MLRKRNIIITTTNNDYNDNDEMRWQARSRLRDTVTDSSWEGVRVAFFNTTTTTIIILIIFYANIKPRCYRVMNVCLLARALVGETHAAVVYTTRSLLPFGFLWDFGFWLTAV